MDPAVIAALSGLVGTLVVVVNKGLDLWLQRFKVSTDSSRDERRHLSKESAEFIDTLREEMDRLYQRIGDLEQQRSQDQTTISANRETIARLETKADHQQATMDQQQATIDRLESQQAADHQYISVLTQTLREGGYTIPPRPGAEA
jgi:septal ring factor EnvC (AmiA/AmiB activator)